MNSHHGTSVCQVSLLYKRTNHKQVIGTNTFYKFVLPEAVCCCFSNLQCLHFDSNDGLHVCTKFYHALPS